MVACIYKVPREIHFDNLILTSPNCMFLMRFYASIYLIPFVGIETPDRF